MRPDFQRFERWVAIAALAVASAWAQKVPGSPTKPWDVPPNRVLPPKLLQAPPDKYRLSPDHVYALPELIDLAEEHNPETRAAWEVAKQRAGTLKVGRSELFPTLAAAVMGQTLQTGVLLYNQFVLQEEGIGEGDFTLNYTLLDFGARAGLIATERANLLAANFDFNDVHRRIIFQTMSSYYQLLNANGQRRAAEINLENAQAVQQGAEARLAQGLATLPDVLEARSATAQAEYDLQATIGSQETASGDLATLLAASPESQFQVASIETLEVPDHLVDSVDGLMRRALSQRPDLLARVAGIQATEAGVKQARSAYFPDLTFEGSRGYLRAYGEQPPYPSQYGGSGVYNAQLNLSWTIFDGGRRRGNLDAAEAAEKQAEAEADSARDRIADEVWHSYSDAKTALRQRAAATTLLTASTTSFAAARESYNYGVRNILDVLSAQRTLAQARSSDITASTRVLTSFADLAYRTADLLRLRAAQKP